MIFGPLVHCSREWSLEKRSVWCVNDHHWRGPNYVWMTVTEEYYMILWQFQKRAIGCGNDRYKRGLYDVLIRGPYGVWMTDTKEDHMMCEWPIEKKTIWCVNDRYKRRPYDASMTVLFVNDRYRSFLFNMWITFTEEYLMMCE